MVTFNLLPWRQAVQQYEKKILKRFFYSSIISTILLILPIYLQILFKQYATEKRIAQLNLQLKQLANLKQLKSTKFFANNSTNAIRDLIKTDIFMQDLFGTLNEINPYAICFSEINFQKNNFTFQGSTSSLEEFSGFLQQWSGVGFFSEVKVKNLQRQKNNLIQFDIRGV